MFLSLDTSLEITTHSANIPACTPPLVIVTTTVGAPDYMMILRISFSPYPFPSNCVVALFLSIVHPTVRCCSKRKSYRFLVSHLRLPQCRAIGSIRIPRSAFRPRAALSAAASRDILHKLHPSAASSHWLVHDTTWTSVPSLFLLHMA